MRVRVLAGLWLLVGLAVWNGFFDLYVSRGAREYGQKQAEHELGQGPAVSMTAVMNDAKHDGVIGASAWTLGILAAGFGTIWASRGVRGTGRQVPGTGHQALGTGRFASRTSHLARSTSYLAPSTSHLARSTSHAPRPSPLD